MSVFNKNLGENEEPAKIVRYHPLTVVPALLLSLALLAGGAALGLYIGESTGEPPLAAAALSFSVLAALTIAVRRLMAWRRSGFMLTDRRAVVFRQKGFFGHQVSEIALDKIEDVSYRIKGLFQTVLNCGTVTVQAAGDSKIKLKNIPHPQRVQESIMFFRSRIDGRLKKEAAVEAASREQAKGPITAEEALDRLPPEELARLTRLVNKIKSGSR